MIPKRVFTIWLSEDGSMPELVRRCITSQQIEGYEHYLITITDCKTHGFLRDRPYVRQCLDSPHVKLRWAKLSDYLRVLLLADGGIYLDADVEVLPGRNFDALLGCPLFVGREQPGLNDAGYTPWACNAVLGAAPDNPLIAEWLCRIEGSFRGDDDRVFEPAMQVLNELLLAQRRLDMSAGITSFMECGASVLYPYCWRQQLVALTNETICWHHFMRSWV